MTAKKTTKRKPTTPKGKTARITAIANQKGGVGKTTTAHALVAGLTRLGYKALAVDIDPQSNLTFTLNPPKTTPNMYGLMLAAAGGKDLAILTEKAIKHTNQGDVISSSLMLAGADFEFHRLNAEYLLSEILNPIRSLYDYIIIDTPPTLGILTVVALVAADEVIIPVGFDAYSIQGLSQLQDTINTLKKRHNQSLTISGLLITRHGRRTRLGEGLNCDINKKAEELGTIVFKSIIRESVEVKEAQLEQRNLYNNKSNHAVADYLTFVEEYVKGAK